MKIFFRKILEYDTKKGQPDSFIYACKLLSQEVSPDSLQKGGFISLSNIILSSNLKRAKQCIKKDISLKIIFNSSLNEIPFELASNCSKSQYEKYGSRIVRRVFKKLFIEDKLMIKRRKIFREIENLLSFIRKNFKSEKNIMILSHSFRLKCIEAYLKTSGKIIQNPELMEQYIDDSRKTFNFGQGFDFDI